MDFNGIFNGVILQVLNGCLYSSHTYVVSCNIVWTCEVFQLYRLNPMYLALAETSFSMYTTLS